MILYLHIVTLDTKKNALDSIELPSGNQTWQWNIPPIQSLLI